MKWIQARSNEDDSEVYNVAAHISEESDTESHPDNPVEDESDSNKEKTDDTDDESDTELFYTNKNQFSTLLPDD